MKKEIDFPFSKATYNRGLLLWRSGRITDDILVKQLEEVRTTHKGDWRDEYYLGLVHIERGDAESSIKVLEEASLAAPEESEIQRALTLACSGQGKGYSYQRTFEGHTSFVTSVAISSDGKYALSGSRDETLRLWYLDWDYEFPDETDWDEGARPYLGVFLILHSGGRNWLGRWKRPRWTDDDFNKLLKELQYRGFGWLRPEGVRKKLEEMSTNWQGPPPLAGQE